jgi:hypothetical protein
MSFLEADLGDWLCLATISSIALFGSRGSSYPVSSFCR